MINSQNDFNKLLLQGPLQVFLGLTYNCNLKCPHCYAKNKKNKYSLTLNQINKILQDLTKMGVFKIVLSHGENLLYPHFFKVLHNIKKYNFNCTLISNGCLINKDIARKLKNYNIDKVFISIDSAKAEKHDKYRGVSGLWNKATNALCFMNKIGIKTGCATTLTNLNYQEVEDIVNLAIKIGCKEISFLTLRTNQNINLELSNDQYRNVVNKIIFLKERLKNKINILTHDPLISIMVKNSNEYKDIWDRIIQENQCGAGKYFLSITPDGNMYPCNLLNNKLGNINDGISKIWQDSEEIKKLREIPTKCSDCKLVDLCQGGCRAFAYYKKSNKDPRCKKLII